ncbi:MAG: hypothetical protein JWM34_447 [Ilumatobacteraceae bacterium]|nr:hypothetical protein [Ilumatobacteraceae bacterium]
MTPITSAFVGEPSLFRPLESVLQQIDGARHASFSRTSDEGPMICASTDSAIEPLGPTRPGPTTAAAAAGRIVRVPTVERNTEFAEYAHWCSEVGIHSVAAFPCDVDGITVGVLTVSSEDHHGFSAADLRTGRAAAAGIVEFAVDRIGADDGCV